MYLLKSNALLYDFQELLDNTIENLKNFKFSMIDLYEKPK